MRKLTLCSATLGEDGKMEPPLGPLYIASAFRSQGVDVDFRDFQLEPGANGYSGRTLAGFLRDHAEHVAISCFVDMLPAVVDATRCLKEAAPRTSILIGGPGPTAVAVQILEAYEWIDAVGLSEGEEVAADWVRLQRGELLLGTPVPGLAYRCHGRIVLGPPRKRIKEIDDIVQPAYDLVEWEKYTSARVITTRGCSYACSFCDVTFLWGRRSVFREMEKVIDEMLFLRKQYGQTAIGIVDDTFVLNRDRVKWFCREMIRRKVDIKWGCFGRINLMTEELVGLMAEAGCAAIFYGIDSGSQEVLDATVKKVRKADILPVLELSVRYFAHVEASFIWGYPFETFEQFTETVELAAAASFFAPKVNVQLHMLSPLPSSPLYREFQGSLAAPEEEDLQWLLLPPLLLNSAKSELRDLILARPDIYPGFFSFPTPEKEKKRATLRKALGELHRMIGLTFVDPAVADLVKRPNISLEEFLMQTEHLPENRIGRGLALGYFRRLRNGRSNLGTAPTDGDRGPHFVRQSNGIRLP